MAELNTCPLFWIEHPKVLIEDAADFFPFGPEAKRCTTVALNSLTRFGLYLGLLLVVLTHKPLYFGVPVLTIILAVALFYSMKSQGTLRSGDGPGAIEKPSFHEGFANVEGSAATNKVVEDIIGVKYRADPSGPNPFMNVLINELSDFPTRPPAKYSASSEVKTQLSQQFQVQVYGDPGDVWNRNQGQRQFYTNPSTSIPNDRESYQNWLYRIPGKTCKEGNIAVCKPATDGGPIVSVNQA